MRTRDRFKRSAGPSGASSPRKPAHDIVAIALDEDAVKNDLTSRHFVVDRPVHARIFAKENAVIAGMEIARDIFRRIDQTVRVTVVRHDGTRVKKNETVIEMRGSARSI